MAKSTVDICRFLKELNNAIDTFGSDENLSIQIWQDGSYRLVDHKGDVLYDSDEQSFLEDDVHNLMYENPVAVFNTLHHHSVTDRLEIRDGNTFVVKGEDE